MRPCDDGRSIWAAHLRGVFLLDARYLPGACGSIQERLSLQVAAAGDRIIAKDRIAVAPGPVSGSCAPENLPNRSFGII